MVSEMKGEKLDNAKNYALKYCTMHNSILVDLGANYSRDMLSYRYQARPTTLKLE